MKSLWFRCVGSAFNSRSEVIGAVSNQNSAYNYAYSFDPIGNRLTANLAGTSYNYTTNMLNQYTVVNSNQPTYDDDGNMLTNGSWTYTWNGENRMIQAVNGNTKLQFVYDYMGRRVEKKVFDGDTIVSHKRFVYDDYKQVEELDASNSNSVLKRYSWQPEAVGQDVPLSMTDVVTAKNYTYTLDANKNVSDLTDAQGNVVAHYEYSPFGTHTATGSYTGNPFRFSSEVFDSETGLVYYNYRYYNPNLGRWINRDPIGLLDGPGLYVFVNNSANFIFDVLGLKKCQIHIAIGHGKMNKDGSISPDSDIGQYAQNFAGDNPDQCSAVAIIGCWTKQTMIAVNNKRRRQGKKPINWVYPVSSTIPNQREYVPYVIGDSRKLGPDEDSNYVPKGLGQVERETWNEAIKTARSICNNRRKCCKKVTIIEFKIETSWLGKSSVRERKRKEILCR